MILLRFLKIMHRGGANVLLNDQTVGPTRNTGSNGLWLVWTTWFPNRSNHFLLNRWFYFNGRPAMETLIFNLLVLNHGQSELRTEALNGTRTRTEAAGLAGLALSSQ